MKFCLFLDMSFKGYFYCTFFIFQSLSRKVNLDCVEKSRSSSSSHEFSYYSDFRQCWGINTLSFGQIKHISERIWVNTRLLQQKELRRNFHVGVWSGHTLEQCRNDFYCATFDWSLKMIWVMPILICPASPSITHLQCVSAPLRWMREKRERDLH